jgi:peptide/nickel transport system ATP-binding protein
MRCATHWRRKTPVAEPGEALLAVRGLRVTYAGPTGTVQAVDGVDLDLAAGECLGIVGESGSGKTQLLQAIPRLSARGARVEGSIRYRGQELMLADEAQLAAVRGARIAITWQDAQGTLNPYLPIGTQLVEGVMHHRRLDRTAARERALGLLDQLGVAGGDEGLARHPHELSGGMLQRVGVAMALMCEPDVLLLDEPTTALDATVQLQLLGLLRAWMQRSGGALLLVTHDIGALRAVADRVAVMYAGRIVEQCPRDELLRSPAHPYAQGLLRALPGLDGPIPEALPVIPGQPPDPSRRPAGCAFAPRCAIAQDACTTVPPLRAIAAGHACACHLAQAPADMAERT